MVTFLFVIVSQFSPCPTRNSTIQFHCMCLIITNGTVRATTASKSGAPIRLSTSTRISVYFLPTCQSLLRPFLVQTFGRSKIMLNDYWQKQNGNLRQDVECLKTISKRKATGLLLMQHAFRMICCTSPRTWRHFSGDSLLYLDYWSEIWESAFTFVLSRHRKCAS